ncbi:hypothetical protein QYZ43_16820 [Vibrio parahaemolyticus]|nr:hypothetical protein [Vibrio parahaemolyticus]MDN4708482.1 hypothetical protein [Vibrio parahaemolyticus]MDN4712628.1 hypothetical protein [Vibrio parahaemolyticus]MDN4716554.1 hypothetical protein [Vibrio parahaemolyticus]MDN4718897.1 hypothetical protein [Vibrio parahaemolyticus]
MLGIETSSHLENITMRVFIAEKPSLAAAIFKGLGGNVNTEKKTAITNMAKTS